MALPTAADPAAVPELTTSKTRFEWSVLESPDYRVYMGNLRSIGCPESTINDIILGDLERLYVQKAFAVSPNIGFWECGPKRAAAERKEKQDRAALKKELRETVKALLGTDYLQQEKYSEDDLVSAAILRFIMGPLPEQVAEGAMMEMQRTQALVEELEQRGQSFELPETESEVRQAYDASAARLRAVLGPEAFEELACRTAALKLMDNGYEELKASPAEWRQIARMHVEICGLSSENSFRLFDKSPRDEAAEGRFKVRLQEYVGPERWADFLREKDPVFRSAITLTRQQHLPRETAERIYDIKLLLEAETTRVTREASQLSGDPRAAQEDIASAAVLGVQTLLGPDLFRTYLGEGRGYWLTNFLFQ